FEVFAQTQKPALRAMLERQRVPFGPAHRTEQHGICRACLRHHRIGRGRTMRLVRDAADQIFVDRVGELAVLAEPFEHAARLGHHFGPDAVTGQQQDFVGHLYFRMRARRSAVSGPLPSLRWTSWASPAFRDMPSVSSISFLIAQLERQELARTSFTNAATVASSSASATQILASPIFSASRPP